MPTRPNVHRPVSKGPREAHNLSFQLENEPFHCCALQAQTEARHEVPLVRTTAVTLVDEIAYRYLHGRILRTKAGRQDLANPTSAGFVESSPQVGPIDATTDLGTKTEQALTLLFVN